jgi:shikimate kinase
MMSTNRDDGGAADTRAMDPASKTEPTGLLPKGKRQLHLTGFMCSGKSTVGRRLARLLDWEFIDLDEAIAERAGKSVAEIFADAGEAVFRALEDQLLLEISVLATTHSAVRGVIVALGGGTLMDPENRELCASIATIVWLRCPVEVVEERFTQGGAGNRRPLWGSTEELEQRMVQREPGYRGADFAVDATGTPEEVSDKVLALLGAEGLPLA